VPQPPTPLQSHWVERGRRRHEQAVAAGLGYFLDPLQDFAEDMKNNAGLPVFVKNLSKHSARYLTK
jgi:hypothetical protein